MMLQEFSYLAKHSRLVSRQPECLSITRVFAYVCAVDGCSGTLACFAVAHSDVTEYASLYIDRVYAVESAPVLVCTFEQLCHNIAVKSILTFQARRQTILLC